MRNAVTLSACKNRFDTIPLNLELFHDFGDAYAIIEIIDNRVDRHPRAQQHRSATLHSGLNLDERHSDQSTLSFEAVGLPPVHHDSMFSPRRPATP
jgi:hypothetical protein